MRDSSLIRDGSRMSCVPINRPLAILNRACYFDLRFNKRGKINKNFAIDQIRIKRATAI